MFQRSFVLLALVASTTLIAATTKNITGKEALNTIVNFFFEDSIGGYFSNGKPCLSTIQKKSGGLLLAIKSETTGETAASAFLSEKANVLATYSGTSGSPRVTYRFSVNGVNKTVSITSYEDISSFDLMIRSEGEAAVTCSYQE